jgi:hypothetical protein
LREVKPIASLRRYCCEGTYFRSEVMAWTKAIVVVIAFIGVLFAALALYGKRKWDATTDALFAQMDNARKPANVKRLDAKEFEGLPPVVARYFKTALAEDAPLVSGVSISHTGTFNMSESAEKWLPFRSTQRVTTNPPAFVWDGRVQVFPWVNVHVHDAYVDREGLLHPAILGVFSLTELRGKGEIAQGEFMRYLAEAAWYPTALLPSQGVIWRGIDERTAEATLADGEVKSTLRFTFSSDGLIESVHAEARGRTVGSAIVPTPWEGRWSNYESRDGMRVPMAGEVAWITPEGRKPYWRGTIASLAYEFAK